WKEAAKVHTFSICAREEVFPSSFAGKKFPFQPRFSLKKLRFLLELTKACWKRYDTIVGKKGTAHIKKMIKTYPYPNVKLLISYLTKGKVRDE
ncbi:MAG: hypothetical protein IJQ14_02815, partial [Bacteroidales bacterium]|nr:hypothetical protein [Bacteroidales bacterium]